MKKRTDPSKEVLRLGEGGMLGIAQHHVPVFLQRFDLRKSLPKKVHELLVGYIMIQFLKEEQRESAIIGFPAAERWEKHCAEGQLTLDWLFKHHGKLVKDTDVDIQVSTCGMTTKYQVTRFVYRHGQNAHRRLAQLIAKKCRNQQQDSSLNLLVSIEKTPDISEDELRNLLMNNRIPFGAILLLMKASDKRGHFSILQLYPKLVLGKNIIIPLPV